VWTRARNPDLARRAGALAEAEALVLKSRRLQRPLKYGLVFSERPEIYLREARRVLEAAGAETSRDPLLRFRLAEVLVDLGEHAGAAKHYEVAVRSPSLAAPLRASGLMDLAVCYARLGRHEEEIKAYTEALSLEPLGPVRATLLANRAEAYMVLGDITKAIEGYRASLRSLLVVEMFSYGVTTLWGLGVALDRSGDLESGLGSIRLARDYDPSDRLINGSGWFYVPPYDEAWYAALGHWVRARQATLSMARAESYGSAVEAWERYIERAPETDRWLALAKARLRACMEERDAALEKEKETKPQGKVKPRPNPAAPRGAPTKG
jgi:tetratricopeptide (TPR) repeat protein